MAGHSHWANIKHKKAKTDAKRGKVWGKCAKAIMVAAKNGGPDPAANLTLRYAIEEARAANMPRDTIERAVKKGAGELGADAYESIRYEGYGPGGVAVIVDALTDNRTRTVGEVRLAFTKFGGNLGASGCVAYLFEQKGQFTLPEEKATEEKIMSAALEAGADDAWLDEGVWTITCPPTDFIAVKEALEAAGLETDSSEITMIPGTLTEVTGDAVAKAVRLIDALEDNDDVQKVYTNMDASAEALEAAMK